MHTGNGIASMFGSQIEQVIEAGTQRLIFSTRQFCHAPLCPDRVTKADQLASPIDFARG